MISDPNMRISRPRQLYTGSVRRDYLPTAERTPATESKVSA
jgi:citrate synthase